MVPETEDRYMDRRMPGNSKRGEFRTQNTEFRIQNIFLEFCLPMFHLLLLDGESYQQQGSRFNDVPIGYISGALEDRPPV